MTLLLGQAPGAVYHFWLTCPSKPVGKRTMGIEITPDSFKFRWTGTSNSPFFSSHSIEAFEGSATSAAWNSRANSRKYQDSHLRSDVAIDAYSKDVSKGSVNELIRSRPSQFTIARHPNLVAFIRRVFHSFFIIRTMQTSAWEEATTGGRTDLTRGGVDLPCTDAGK